MRRCSIVLPLLFSLVASLTAIASEPPQIIDQSRALTGGITPGDAPGLPVTINRSGHYRLGTDLIVPASTSGIVIEAPNVTLDLNGHSVSGPVKCAQNKTTRAVACSAPSRPFTVKGIDGVGAASTVIRNGSVRGFAGLGVHHGAGAVMEGLQIESNAGVGIAGEAHLQVSIVRDVRVANNGAQGIVCEQVHLVGSTFEGNGGDGVDCRRSWFSGCVTRHNGGRGVADGAKLGLHSYGNRLREDFGAAADRSASARATPMR